MTITWCDAVLGVSAYSSATCKACNVPSACDAVDMGRVQVERYGVLSNEVVLQYLAQSSGELAPGLNSVGVLLPSFLPKVAFQLLEGLSPFCLRAGVEVCVGRCVGRT